MPYIRPVGDLRTNSGEIVSIVTKENKPVFLTRHGKGEMVLISMEEYDRLTGLNELYAAVDQGLEDVKAGRVKDAKTVMAQLREDMRNGSV